LIGLCITLASLIGSAWAGESHLPDLRLEVSVVNRRARAILRVPSGEGRQFRTDGLDIEAVRTTPPDAQIALSPDRIVVESEPFIRVIEVDYVLRIEEAIGWLETGATLTWPDGCGQLFPCEPHPSRGLDYELHFTDLPEDHVVVYSPRLGHPGPAYQLAWASGPYVQHKLGETQSGRLVSIWAHRIDEEAALQGTTHLVPVIDWLENTLGPYPYGDELGAVVVPHTPGMAAMEHHPFWHVSSESATHALTHAHEAAHGWYGNSLRIACWEDFVLSEGVASYLAAKALGAVLGGEAEAQIWTSYQVRLDGAEAKHSGPVLETSCTLESAIEGGLYSSLSYMRGAWFFRSLEDQVGEDVVLRALQSFYSEHRSQAVRMTALIAHLESETSHSLALLTQAWLRSETAEDRQSLLERVP
jgi:hypothetical protein